MNGLQYHLLSSKTGRHWEKIGIFPHHGFCLSLSSLLSRESLGIGEFFDLIPLIDWAAFVGMDVIQLLPINDTGDHPSPYNAMSSCALEPAFIRLTSLPGLKDDPRLQDKLKALAKHNEAPLVPFQEVKNLKLDILREYFLFHYSEYHKSASYEQFLEMNSWLPEYGLYKALRKAHPFNVWTSWPSHLQNPPEKDLFLLIKEYNEDIQFYSFLQYIAFQQMGKVKEYACEKKVHLKGDIPILLSPDSADVWFHQEIFDLSFVAGSPPDLFNSSGQKWGFPLFNWEKLKETRYFWWKRRLATAEHFFHIYRMDHVVGFFRIWGVPKDKESLFGHFVSPNRYIWPLHGKERLNMMVESSTMLPIAEDLGTIPHEVYTTLAELGIPGTKIVRWNRYWEEDCSLIKLEDYEPVSITSVSTHDTETLDQWWEKYPHEAQEYAKMRKFPYEPKCTPDIRYKLLKDAHSTPSLFHINLLQEYLALFPELVHEDPDLERINIPGSFRNENWRYRFIPKIEEMISHTELTAIMKSLLERSQEAPLKEDKVILLSAQKD